MKTEKIRIGPKPPTIKRVKYECNEVGGANQWAMEERAAIMTDLR